jgi:hypothetical protein
LKPKPKVDTTKKVVEKPIVLKEMSIVSVNPTLAPVTNCVWLMWGSCFAYSWLVEK